MTPGGSLHDHTGGITGRDGAGGCDLDRRLPILATMRDRETHEGGDAEAYTSNEAIARRVFRALKTPSDDNPRTDPILAFQFRGREDTIMLRCNKQPEVSIKGKNQTAGEVKFFAYSDFADYSEENVLFELRDEITRIELYRKGAVEGQTWPTWEAFSRWLDGLDENGVPISLKLPCLVYEAVKHQSPSMQNFIVEAVKRALRKDREA